MPDIEIDMEFTMIHYEGILVFSKKELILPKNRDRIYFDVNKVRLVTDSLKKIKKRVFEF